MPPLLSIAPLASYWGTSVDKAGPAIRPILLRFFRAFLTDSPPGSGSELLLLNILGKTSDDVTLDDETHKAGTPILLRLVLVERTLTLLWVSQLPLSPSVYCGGSQRRILCFTSNCSH